MLHHTLGFRSNNRILWQMRGRGDGCRQCRGNHHNLRGWWEGAITHLLLQPVSRRRRLRAALRRRFSPLPSLCFYLEWQRGYLDIGGIVAGNNRPCRRRSVARGLMCRGTLATTFVRGTHTGGRGPLRCVFSLLSHFCECRNLPRVVRQSMCKVVLPHFGCVAHCKILGISPGCSGTVARTCHSAGSCRS